MEEGCDRRCDDTRGKLWHVALKPGSCKLGPECICLGRIANRIYSPLCCAQLRLTSHANPSVLRFGSNSSAIFAWKRAQYCSGGRHEIPSLSNRRTWTFHQSSIRFWSVQRCRMSIMPSERESAIVLKQMPHQNSKNGEQRRVNAADKMQSEVECF